MNEIEIINNTNEEIKELDILNDLLEFALKKEKQEHVIFNIIIVIVIVIVIVMIVILLLCFG